MQSDPKPVRSRRYIFLVAIAIACVLAVCLVLVWMRSRVDLESTFGVEISGKYESHHLQSFDPIGSTIAVGIMPAQGFKIAPKDTAHKVQWASVDIDPDACFENDGPGRIPIGRASFSVFEGDAEELFLLGRIRGRSSILNLTMASWQNTDAAYRLSILVDPGNERMLAVTLSRIKP